MISFICGELCSGKTLYSKTLAQISDCVYLEAGDMVRQIKLTTDRKVLQDTKELWQSIAVLIQYEMDINSPKQLVISGVRQKEILQEFPEATLLWIDCPPEVRKQRYNERAREGDSQSFEEANLGDVALGIHGVKDYIFNRNKFVMEMTFPQTTNTPASE